MILINRELIQVHGRILERYRVGMTAMSFDGTKIDFLWVAGITIYATGMGLDLTDTADDAALITEEAAMHTVNCVKILIKSKTLGYNATNNEFYQACGDEMYSCKLERRSWKEPAKPVNFRPVVPIYPTKI